MPVEIRTLAPTFTAAGYRFPVVRDNATYENWPWLRSSSNVKNLCENCSRLDFHWLFTQALSGYTVTDGALSARLSDGICLGLHKDISNRSNCQFCQLIVHALEYGADIEMLNQYDVWSQREVWINNHFYDAQGSVTMVPVADGVERVARLGIRFKSETEDNLIFKHGGRQVTIQQIIEIENSPVPLSGRALSRSSAELAQLIKGWKQLCSLQGHAAHGARRDTSASLRLIDTQDQCIVGPVSDRRYVALR